MSPREKQLMAIEWFVISFVSPRQACMFTGGDSLVHYDEVMALYRKDNLATFELIEKTPEYIASTAALRRSFVNRFRGEKAKERAANECSQQTSHLEAAYKKNYYNESFDELRAMFSPPR